MNKLIIHIILLVLLTSNVFGQTKQTLEAQKKKIQEEIKSTEKMLEKTKASKKTSQSELTTLEKQIALRQKLISSTQGEVTIYSSQIQQKASSLTSLESSLDRLKKEYAKIIYKTYRYQRFSNKLLFIASAKSFGESLRRLNYVRKFSSYRRKQAQTIQNTKLKIAHNLMDINEKKHEKEQLLTKQTTQQKILNTEKQKKSKLVETLKGKEKDLAATLKQKQKESEKLNAQIEAVIKKEILLAKQKADEQAKKEKELAAKKKLEEDAKKLAENKTEKTTTTASTTTTTPVKTTTTVVKNTPVKPIEKTPEVSSLTSSFYGNKGKLPWPVEKGFITKGFGADTHPDLKDIQFQNNGIDIKTDKNAAVRVVYEGTVVGIISNPVYKNAVIISHGDYFTVYSKLASVNVSKGQKVKTKEVIGYAYTDGDNTEVHLEVWKGEIKLNPVDWIVRK